MYRFSNSSLLAVLILICGLATAIYWPGLSGSFLFDDGPSLTDNHYLRIDGKAFDDWRVASFSSDAGLLRRPIAMWSFAVNILVAGGVEPFPIKFVNLLIHLACGLLVFFLARGVLTHCEEGETRSWVTWVSLLAMVLWLLAPLHVSTVIYAVQRMAQLSTLFMLVGLVLFVSRRTEWAQRGASAGDLAATSLWLMLCTFLAALSKENGVLLLWLLPVVEVTCFRGQWAGKDCPALRYLGWTALCVPLLLLIAILLLSPGSIIGGYSGRDFTVQERLLTQLRSLWQYLGWMVYPDIKSMGFQHDDIALSVGWWSPASTLFAAIAWLTLVLLAFLTRRKFPLLLFAALFYLVGHFMESGVWPLEMVYEHRNYLPSVGVYIFLATALAGLFRRQSFLRPWVLGFTIITVSSTLLFLRVFTWSDHLLLSTTNAVNHPDSSRSHFFLGQSWLRAYRDALEAGEGSDVLGEYLVLARNEFELMYQDNHRDFSAIVMLYYLDQHHFQELQSYNDWFASLEDLAADRPLQASDFNALEALLDCFVAVVCKDSQERLFSFLDTLEQRYPGNSRLPLLKYRYLKSTDSPLADRMSLLLGVQARSPGSNQVYQYLLVEQSEYGAPTDLYETVAAWMANDPNRRQLKVIRNLFELPEADTSTYKLKSASPYQ